MHHLPRVAQDSVGGGGIWLQFWGKQPAQGYSPQISHMRGSFRGPHVEREDHLAISWLCKSSQESENMIRWGCGPPRQRAVPPHSGAGEQPRGRGWKLGGSLQNCCTEQILSGTEKSPPGLPLLERNIGTFQWVLSLLHFSLVPSYSTLCVLTT